MKTELSKKSKWYLPRHRYLELMHFCLQWEDWKKDMTYVSYLKSHSSVETVVNRGKTYSRTEAIAILEAECSKKIVLVTNTVIEALRGEKANEVAEAISLKDFLFKGITTGQSYDTMSAKCDNVAPCSRNEYYDYYRKFFWLLDKKKD